MKRRQFLYIAAGAVTAAVFGLKPKDSGASYAPYFNGLNDELKKNGPFKPIMLIDLDKLDRNIQALKHGMDRRLAQPRD